MSHTAIELKSKKIILRVFFLNVFVFALLGCGLTHTNDEQLIGIWVNEDEGCEIEFRRDSFMCRNLPLDVMNKIHLNFDEEIKVLQGVWGVENGEVRLSMSESYYYMNLNRDLFSGKVQLCIELNDEGGNEILFLDKRK